MTFTELFQKMELGEFFDGFGWILDAPEATFSQLKNDFKDSIIESFNAANFQTVLNGNQASGIELVDIKESISQTGDIFREIFDTMEEELPKDRIDFFLEILDTISSEIQELPDRRIVDVIIEKIDEHAQIPTYAHPSDAGADIYSAETITINPGATIVVSTGLKVAIPFGYEIQIRPRSGMSLKTPIRVANAPGTIDSGYRDTVGVICHNTSIYPYTINQGDRIAQMVISPVPMINFIEGTVSEVDGDRLGGFGSTGE